MDLPLIRQHPDAICIDHVLPTTAGAHVHTEPVSAREQDRRLAGLPGRDGHIYLSFGDEIDRALSQGRDAPGAARGQAVMHQFLRGLPAEAADRAVVRVLDPAGLTLGAVAARADLAGLPIEVRLADLVVPEPGAAAVDPARLLGFTAAMELTPVADAEIVWVAPARHWAADAYAGAGPDVLRAALRTPYPSARLVLDGTGGVHLGMPAALVRHAYAAGLATLGRALGADDLPDGPARPIRGYGDLLAAMATPGSRAFVTVSTPSGADRTVLAQHDRHGVSFLDPGTGGAAVLPAAPSRIVLHPVDGTADLSSWLDEIRAGRPDAPAPRPIRHSPGMHALPIGDTGRSIDVIGPPGLLRAPFLAEITAAAAGVDSPVVVVATDRPSAAPSPRQLFDLEWLLLQHRLNQRAGGATPIVVVRGEAPAAMTDLRAGYDFAVVQQSRTSGGGLGLNLDNLWSGRDAAGNPVAAPVRTITADFLRAAGTLRRGPVPAGEPPDERLLSLLFTPLTDVAGIRSVLAEHGSALKTLAPGIATLGVVQHDLLAGWEAILRIEGRGDPAVTEAAYRYLGTDSPSLAFLPPVATEDPGVLTDLIDLTKGPLDDGASRALLSAITLGIQGGPMDQIRQTIHQHSVYLPETGRTDWIRELRELTLRMPEHSGLFEQVAVFVETCP